MRKWRSFVAGLIVVVALAVGGTFLQREYHNPHWFTDGEIQDLVLHEPPPPVTDSTEDKADLQAGVLAQTGLLVERIAEARADSHYSIRLFTDALGPRLTRGNSPATFHFFDRLNEQVRRIVSASKDHWRRPRPYQTHREIRQLVDVDGYSYPSGHSTHSFAFAMILGELFPDRKAAFLERAQQIAQSRVDAGVHYVTDIREGEVLGKEIARDLLAKPAFLQELNAAKAELAR